MALAPGGIQRRNPCPGCSATPHLVPGILLGRETDRNFLVCWPCNQLRRVARGEEWQRVELPGVRSLSDDRAPRRRRRRR